MRSDLLSRAVNERIPLSVPHLCGNEAIYLQQCIESGWVSSAGPFVERLENQIAEFVKTRFAVATSSGTAALHLALRATGVRADEEVLMPSVTFIAPANAIRYMGAWPVLMDSDPLHWQMDVNKMRDFLQRECGFNQGQLTNRQTGRRIRAVIPVHVLGHPVDMDPIMNLAEEFSLIVIEDATESLGSEYKGRRTGSLGH